MIRPWETERVLKEACADEAADSPSITGEVSTPHLLLRCPTELSQQQTSGASVHFDQLICSLSVQTLHCCWNPRACRSISHFSKHPLSPAAPPHPTPSPNPSPPSFSLWLLMAWCSITRISCWEQGSIIKGLAWEITLGCRCVSPTAHYNSQLFRCFWSLTSHQVFFSVLKKIVGTLKDWQRLPRLL